MQCDVCLQLSLLLLNTCVHLLAAPQNAMTSGKVTCPFRARSVPSLASEMSEGSPERVRVSRLRRRTTREVCDQGVEAVCHMCCADNLH